MAQPPRLQQRRQPPRAQTHIHQRHLIKIKNKKKEKKTTKIKTQLPPPTASPTPTHCRCQPTHHRLIFRNPFTGRSSHHRFRTTEPTTTNSPITSRPTHHWIWPSQPTTSDPPITISTHPLPNQVSNHYQKNKKKKPQRQRSEWTKKRVRRKN